MRDFPTTKKSDCMPMAEESFSIIIISKWIRFGIQPSCLVRKVPYVRRNQKIDLLRLSGEWLEVFSGGLGIASWQSSLMMSDDKGLYPKLFINYLNPLIGRHDGLSQWNGKCERIDLHDGVILCPANHEATP